MPMGKLKRYKAKKQPTHDATDVSLVNADL